MILNTICPTCHLAGGFSFALEHRVSFFDGLQDSSINGFSAASCNFGVLAGEDELTSFYSAILNVHLFKAMVLSVVMYGYKSWTIKKTECRRIDAFELWCWRRLLRVPCTARRSNQSILKEISPECSLESLMFEAETPILWPPDAKK